MKVKDHYENHLANFYSWMIDDFDEKQYEQEAFLRKYSITPFSTKIAFDLGAGHGLQTVSLSKLNFKVKAVDFSKQLLEELRVRINPAEVEIITDDLLSFLEVQIQNRNQADAIVCMGDTLTHLDDINQVHDLISKSASILVMGGKIVLSYRDLSNDLEQTDRFIPVKNDEQRILTIFLEYFTDHVMVHDILYEKENEKWNLKVSAYPKLKISEATVLEIITNTKLKLTHRSQRKGMLYLIAEKPLSS